VKLGIIIGSTRQNRKTPNMAKWIYQGATQIEGVQPELIDLNDYPMPFFDEPISPRYNLNRTINPAAIPWLKNLEKHDAYVFVIPEYNHAIPGVLKNALDYVTWEMQRKPASIVSHGSAGGARAAINLKIILSEIRAIPLPTYTPLTMVGMSELIDEAGNLTEAAKAKPYDLNKIRSEMLRELKWYSDALTVARDQL
jgi:NAD(P)H-dependent FMN reductase